MRIGLFTDTYFPQVSGVATSICTLKEELEKEGHEVYIFTTTDKAVKRYEDPTIIRLPSVPFISFTDRRIVYRGLISSYKIAKGKIIKPGMVKYVMRGYMNDLDGVICPSRIVLNLLDGYDIKIPKRVIPTGIRVEEYERKDITREDALALREKLGIAEDETMLLSLSRISYEKNIQAIVQQFPDVLGQNKSVKLVVVGDGPYLSDLKKMVEDLDIEDSVIFTGMVAHEETAIYYKAADFFISASTSETQGLTYTESLASGTPVIAHGNPYLDDIIDQKMFGTLFYQEEDLANAILDAIENTPAMADKAYQAKMYAISAEHFGKSVYAFYLDVLISAKNKKKEKFSLTVRGQKEKTSVKLAHSAIKLPAEAAKATVKTSAKVFKAPKRLINSIRDFLD